MRIEPYTDDDSGNTWTLITADGFTQEIRYRETGITVTLLKDGNKIAESPECQSLRKALDEVYGEENEPIIKAESQEFITRMIQALETDDEV